MFNNFDKFYSVRFTRTTTVDGEMDYILNILSVFL